MLNILVVAMEISESVSYAKNSILLLISNLHFKDLRSGTSPQVTSVMAAFRSFIGHLFNAVHNFGLPQLIAHKMHF